MENIAEEKCLACTLTAKYAYLDLDEKKNCKYCRGFKRKTFKGLEQLVRDVNLANGEKIGITVSGGKDSIYMWGVLTELFGKDNVVAFSYYRPVLTHDLALANIHAAEAVLGSKLVIIEDGSAFERFKKNFSILLKKPDPAMIRVLLCVGCRYGITKNIYREGERLGVRKFISGASYLELAPFKEELLQAKSKKNDINEGLETGLKLYPDLDFDDNLSLIRRDQNYKYKNNETLGNNISRLNSQYELFDFDDYVENNPDFIEQELKQKFNWKSTERSWHFDCIIEEFKDMFYYGLLGYTETNFKLAAMVRYNLISKQDAQESIRKSNEDLKHSYTKMENMLKEYGMADSISDLKAFYQSSKYLEYSKED